MCYDPEVEEAINAEIKAANPEPILEEEMEVQLPCGGMIHAFVSFWPDGRVTTQSHFYSASEMGELEFYAEQAEEEARINELEAAFWERFENPE